MELLSHLKPGDILREADLASYIGAMGLGVAEAQRALDDNTLHMLTEFTQPLPTMANKSLLQLGLTPAFYHFRTATLSCSLGMNLRVTQSINVGGGLSMGGSQSSTKKITSGKKATTSATQSFTLSGGFEVKAHKQGQAMESIDSYAEANSQSSQTFALAERVAVVDRSQFTGSGLVGYQSTADLFVVPPAGLRWAVIQLAVASASGESYQLLPSPAPAYAPAAGTAPADLAIGIKAASGGALVWILAATGSDLSEVRFETGSHVIKTVDGVDYPARLRALAKIIKTAGVPIQVVGHTDGVGPAAYNQRLSELRAAAVIDVLRANGVTAGATSAGTGEAGTINNVAAADQRYARIRTTGLTGVYLYLEEAVAGDLNPNPVLQISPGQNGWVHTEVYAADGAGTTTGGTVQTATELVSKIEAAGAFTASSFGELVYVTNREGDSRKVATVHVYSAQESSLDESDRATFDTVEESASSSSTVETSETTENHASAVAFSLDARYSRMFDLTMSGNMSVSAELVSVPPPAEFLEFIKDLGD